MAIAEAAIQYSETCISFCDRAQVCQQRALAAGDPALLGNDVARFVGEVDLHRAVQLLGGAHSVTPAEEDLLRRMREADVHGHLG